MNPLIRLSQEVKEALDHHQPVVALESTIISHGMPYPQNVEMARKTEQIIREHGAVPATIALMDGKIQVGLDDQQLELLATAPNVAKVSRRDFAEILASQQIGATTVASTMIAAKLAGIKVFVTGGIGGVHREGQDSMDISADLEELSQTNLTVVCAGAKAILDLGRTMEYLETKGVPVVGYQTDYLPAFYSRTSDVALNLRKDHPEEIAALMHYQDVAELKSAILVTNPIPAEHEIPHEDIDQIIQQALAEEKEAGVHGKDSTPFLLAKIVELTEGRSLASNIELVYNNARLGAEIAVAYQAYQ
ncbi:pseudouridine-5'-phosphate glycosidase [Ignavigranum ruoffiae]|uniref:Pseudouridine-5'-phosphate glycosidase n=1 Tax=Ignavigranum ruoffiae TaxID=89093 RepID=A0A1H9C499_9LACT|nr:pseudouridine-5'-phosphate glycosidase [Ignavigranum ruoffiae]SEP95952.1 pseudouridine-5'-phosphate glycosidase [Ignavigranum ruoffiae]